MRVTIYRYDDLGNERIEGVRHADEVAEAENMVGVEYEAMILNLRKSGRYWLSSSRMLILRRENAWDSDRDFVALHRNEDHL